MVEKEAVGWVEFCFATQNKMQPIKEAKKKQIKKEIFTLFWWVTRRFCFRKNTFPPILHKRQHAFIIHAIALPDFPLGASSMLNLCKRTLFGAFCPSSLGIARYSRLNRNKNPTKIVSFPSNFLMEILGLTQNAMEIETKIETKIEYWPDCFFGE